MDRHGDWIQIYSGKPYWPLDPRPEDVDIIDIAAALSKLCRFTGHTTRFYSVAEHSVLVSKSVPEEFAKWGLLHDAAEAYLCDLPAPIKSQPEFSDYRIAEKKNMVCIATHFGLCPKVPAEVKVIDRRIWQDERAALMNPSILQWSCDKYDDLQPLGVEIHGWYPDTAFDVFLDRYREIVS